MVGLALRFEDLFLHGGHSIGEARLRDRFHVIDEPKPEELGAIDPDVLHQVSLFPRARLCFHEGPRDDPVGFEKGLDHAGPKGQGIESGLGELVPGRPFLVGYNVGLFQEVVDGGVESAWRISELVE